MKENKTPQELGRQYERDFEKRYSAKAQPMSGAGAFYKLDNKDSEFLYSLKKTTKQSYSLTKSDLQEMIGATYGLGGVGGETRPVMVINIDGLEVAVTLLDDFIEIQEKGIEEGHFNKSKAKEKRQRADIPSLMRED